MTKTHQQSGTRLHCIWKSMRVRCNNKNRASYKNYGGRGIHVCPEWDDFMQFKLWAETHGYRDDLTLDRIDNDGDYTPDNCRWASRTDQANNRRNSIRLLYKGVWYTPIELSHITGISVNTIYDTHRSQDLIDFTDYQPKTAEYKNVYKRGEHRYEVSISGQYVGTFRSTEEAVVARDQWISKHIRY